MEKDTFSDLKIAYRVELAWGLLLVFGWMGFFFNKILAMEIVIISLVVYSSLNIIRKAILAWFYLRQIKALEDRPND